VYPSVCLRDYSYLRVVGRIMSVYLRGVWAILVLSSGALGWYYFFTGNVSYATFFTAQAVFLSVINRGGVNDMSLQDEDERWWVADVASAIFLFVVIVLLSSCGVSV